MMSYVTAADAGVTGLDLNGAHVALNRLKICGGSPSAGLCHVRALLRRRQLAQQRRSLQDRLAPHLDEAARAYWEGRDRLGRKRIGYFKRNVYRQGLLGGCITAGHTLARLHGLQPRAPPPGEEPCRAAGDLRRRRSRRCSRSGTSAGSWTSRRPCSASASRPRSSRRSRARDPRMARC